MCRLELNSGDNYNTPAKAREREDLNIFWWDYSLGRLFIDGRMAADR
jgi:hypothetical protein